MFAISYNIWILLAILLACIVACIVNFIKIKREAANKEIEDEEEVTEE